MFEMDKIVSRDDNKVGFLGNHPALPLTRYTWNLNK